jgi:translation elongation factor EF-1alpha
VSTFLLKIGYSSNQFSFCPVSGFTGENLLKPVKSKWYKGHTLVDMLGILSSNAKRQIHSSN